MSLARVRLTRLEAITIRSPVIVLLRVLMLMLKRRIESHDFRTGKEDLLLLCRALSPWWDSVRCRDKYCNSSHVVLILVAEPRLGDVEYLKCRSAVGATMN